MALLERQAQHNLGKWIPLTTPKYVTPPLPRVLGVFDRISRGERVFACIEAPPRHGKSDTLFHGFVRHLKQHPEKLVAYVTYSADFARDQSRKARAIAGRAGVVTTTERELENGFDPSASVRLWQTADGGGFMALGRSGALVGKGVDLLGIDDPFKDRAEAESPRVRDQVFEDWYQGTVMTRLEPGASVIVSHQRWNDDDLIARIRARFEAGKAGRPWEFITYSAIDDQGVPLWADRYDLAELAAIRAEVEEYNWWSQYMQQPIRKGDKLFPAFATYPRDQLWIGARHVFALDPAGSSKTRADRFALGWFTFFGYGREMRMFVRRVWGGRLAIPDLVRFTREKMAEYPAIPLLVEAVGGFKSVPQSLLDIDADLPVTECYPAADKFVRFQAPSGGCKSSRILVPESEAEGETWVKEYTTELGRITGVGDKQDDQGDITAYAWQWGLEQAEYTPSASGQRTAHETGGF